MPGTRVFKSATIIAGLNAKTVKGDKASEYATAIMYLAPAKMAGGANLCAMAREAGCDPTHDNGGCLVNSGQAQVFSSINRARIAKTQRYLADRAAFMAELVRDIERFMKWCDKHGVKPAVRLNGTSDIQWEVAHPCIRFGGYYESLFLAFPTVQFYDYTKVYKRVYRQLPSNYQLVLSYSGANQRYADAVTKAAQDTGSNMAVVYRTKELRDYFVDKLVQYGETCRDVIDGDQTDLRFLDPQRVIVGLYAKGRAAKADTSGFVVR
ncbi:hypothetical protein GOL81_23125 [Sinorhizobium medicae]|uniref:GP88 family protein n=1 Tax=Sinorhizobium medicae TaxID=110321 RepID=UPI000C7E19A6|nr:hypothetical protein [Sinorhizobium medicae]MDX0568134.1 hypothetical protein [Sinorhizobium medicae]MDX0580760.1 hypothetical protein [Sinorhizobium medicae]MDX0784377.1 hypothetical protein [Sinorhizobium medicae]MDX0893659.1 hypothetical protein [Sinorhizobium medicae]MDX0935345.1 hypothetical protein [Sinorhizobium medicae]